MGSRAARVGRGMLASGVAIFVAALFHVAGGGSAPSPISLALSMAFATLASIALTAKRLSAWRLVSAVVVSQLLFHVLFSIGASPVRFSSPGGMMPMGAGAHLTIVSGSMPGSAMASPSDLSPAMWLSHATAVLVTVLALRFGEQAFWGLFETTRVHVSRFADRLMVVPVAVPAVVAPVAEAEPARIRDLGLPLARLRHRGPPVVACAF